MDILIGLIIFIVGAAAGFFAAKYASSSLGEQAKLAEQVEQNKQTLDAYKKDVAQHLASSSQLLQEMHNTCQTAMAQMEKSTELLQRATPDEQQAMPFYSQEVQQNLVNSVNKQAVDETITEVPLDYAGVNTGLLSDEKQAVTNS